MTVYRILFYSSPVSSDIHLHVCRGCVKLVTGGSEQIHLPNCCIHLLCLCLSVD